MDVKRLRLLTDYMVSTETLQRVHGNHLVISILTDIALQCVYIQYQASFIICRNPHALQYDMYMYVYCIL